jgi:hypothetical protein
MMRELYEFVVAVLRGLIPGRKPEIAPEPEPEPEVVPAATDAPIPAVAGEAFAAARAADLANRPPEIAPVSAAIGDVILRWGIDDPQSAYEWVVVAQRRAADAARGITPAMRAQMALAAIRDVLDERAAAYRAAGNGHGAPDRVRVPGRLQ